MFLFIYCPGSLGAEVMDIARRLNRIHARWEKIAFLGDMEEGPTLYGALNLLNASEVQKMTEMQTQGTLQTCVASQMMIANMQQRNAAAADLNTAAFIKQQQSSNPQDIGNGSNNWTTYLP